MAHTANKNTKMRTKTLLLSAAALLAGLLSTQAQNVYSANVVGYYNVSVPAHAGGGYWFLGNQLSNTTNDISVVLTNGPVSDPNGNLNTVLAIWNGTSYKNYYYFTDADALNNFGVSSGNGWYDLGGTFYHDPLDPGKGAFVINLQSTNINLTLTGQVPQGTNTAQVNLGYNAFAVVPPISTNLNGLSFPGTSDPNGNLNDVYAYWDPSLQNYRNLYYFTDADALNNFGFSSGDGWYDLSGNNHTTDSTYLPKVGQAFFMIHLMGGTSNWVYSFQVQ